MANLKVQVAKRQSGKVEKLSRYFATLQPYQFLSLLQYNFKLARGTGQERGALSRFTPRGQDNRRLTITSERDAGR